MDTHITEKFIGSRVLIVGQLIEDHISGAALRRVRPGSRACARVSGHRLIAVRAVWVCMIA